MKNLSPYVPGEQPRDREYVKLNANENPFPPSAAVMEAVSSVAPSRLALYPDPDSFELKTAIAEMLNRTGGVLSGPGTSPPLEITPDMIFVGNGSDEVLSFIFYAFFGGGDDPAENPLPVTLPEFTYSFYPVYAGFYGVPLKKVPLKKDLSIDTGALAAPGSCGIIFANPNAPTGMSLPVSEIRRLFSLSPRSMPVVVDEAYVDFGGETALPLLAEYSNLIVVRTFSKSMSFAGMRLGFAVAAPECVQALTTVKNSFNHFPVDMLCQTAGIAACSDAGYYRENCLTIARTRDWFSLRLRENGWRVPESKTNFVFVSKDGLSGGDVYRAAREAGVLIRYFDVPGIKQFVRISIGTRVQMEELLGVLLRL